MLLLCFLQTLKWLILQEKHIDDKGAGYLAEALKHNTVIFNIYIY